MCGFTIYFTNTKNKKEKIKLKKQLINSLDKISYRGPDDIGSWSSNDLNVVMGHCRLNIIDPENGHQPMHSYNKRFVIVFNGEIYNFKELKKNISDSNFQNDSDTEVILKYYELYGKKCVKHFRGMFSFVIYDKKKNEIFAARDRLGIKPLYWLKNKSTIIFSSEIKSIIEFVKNKKINFDTIYDYTCFNFSLSNECFIKGVNEFPRSHFLKINKFLKIKFDKYWDLEKEKSKKNKKNSFDYIINRAINLHTVSDVKICTYLSGGTDSSFINFLVKKKIKNLDAFHGFFEEKGFSELNHARLVAKTLKINLLEKKITEKDFVDNIENIIWSLDQPTAGPGAVCQFIMSNFVKKNNYKVVIGGQGGDEIFIGYTRYYIYKLINSLKNLNFQKIHSIKRLSSLLKNIHQLNNYHDLFKRNFNKNDKIFNDDYLNLINRFEPGKKIYSKNHAQKILSNKNIRRVNNYSNKNIYLFDLYYFLPSLLQVEDRVSMFNGLESRVPFLDHKLIEYLTAIDEENLFKDGKLKFFFKNYLESKLPKKILNRKDKMGFPIPINIWMNKKTKNGLREFILDNLVGSRIKFTSLINKNNFETLYKLSVNNNNLYTREIWNILCLELWYRKFII